MRFLSVHAGTQFGFGLGRFCWFKFEFLYQFCPHVGIPDLQRLRGEFWLPNLWKVDREIAEVGSVARASQSQTSGETAKNSAKCNVAFSHHNCIYKATRPPARVLELLLSRLKHSSQVIKYVLEEPDSVNSWRRKGASLTLGQTQANIKPVDCPKPGNVAVIGQGMPNQRVSWSCG